MVINILAYDLGTKKMGVAMITDGKYVKSYSVGFSKETNIYLQENEAYLDALREWDRIIVPTADDFVAIEQIFLKYGNTRLLIECVGIIMLILAKRNIPCAEINPVKVKEAITGSSKSPKDKKEKKQVMIDGVNKLFNLNITDSDEADAVAVGYTAWKVYGDDKVQG